MADLLHNRALWVLGLVDAVSTLGSWSTTMALFSIVVFRGDGGLVSTSGLLLCSLVPGALLGPLAGSLADRLNRKALLMVAQLGAGGAVLLLIFTQRTAWIFPVVVLESVFASLTSPARQALIPTVVDRSDLTRANALLQQFSSTVKIAGPFLAGLVLAVLAPHQAMWLDVASHVLAAALLLLLLPSSAARPPVAVDAAPAAPAGKGKSKPQVERTGLRAVLTIARENPPLGLLLPLPFLMPLIFQSVDVSSAVFTRDVLQADQRFMGLAIGLIGLGTLLGSGFLLVAKRERNALRDLVLGELLMALIPADFAVSHLLHPAWARALFLGACLVGGLGQGFLSVQSSTLVQRLTPAAWLGRMSGVLSSILVGGQLLGILGTPLLVPHVVSFGVYFALQTMLLLAVALYTALGMRRLGLGAAGMAATVTGGVPRGDTFPA